uniref:Uncharacterized protein n=1 Tax=Aegilops tauschii subsp. strangulata TaxID=200361 RepID=A0A452XZ21_AEGTS
RPMNKFAIVHNWVYGIYVPASVTELMNTGKFIKQIKDLYLNLSSHF